MTVLFIHMSRVTDDTNQLRALEKDDAQSKRLLSDVLLVTLERIEKLAEELKDSRTHGWVMTHRALAFYYVDRFEDAFKCQEIGCQPEFNPLGWKDRHQNLACYAAKVYETDQRRTDMLDRARSILRELHAKGDAKLAKALIKDPELDIVYESDEELKQQKAALIQSPASTQGKAGTAL